MKNKIFGLVALMIWAINLTTSHAQDYQISFVGSGVATIVESVEVTNLTQSTSLTLSSVGDILHLIGLETDVEQVITRKEDIHIYPNPMTESSRLEFITPSSGLAVIELFDISGKNLLSKQFNLTEGIHVFKINNLNTGLYTVRVISNSHLYSEKLISKSASNGNANVYYLSSKNNPNVHTGLKSNSAGNLVEMQYTTGDRLLLTATSGNYSTVKSITPITTTTEIFEFSKCTDGDDNNYTIVNIGNQVWMAENLKTTKYADATAIPTVTDDNLSGTTDDEWVALANNDDAFCYYNNESDSPYGVLYTFEAALNACPTGWHLASDAEWTALENYIADQGHDGAEGAVLKTINGWDFDSNGTNLYGFSVLPCGVRSTGFHEAGNGSYLWSSTTYNSFLAYYRYLGSISSPYNFEMLRDIHTKSYGFSCRCIKD